jgi:hypothetical protein
MMTSPNATDFMTILCFLAGVNPLQTMICEFS